jgi:hypothetical protein
MSDVIMEEAILDQSPEDLATAGTYACEQIDGQWSGKTSAGTEITFNRKINKTIVKAKKADGSRAAAVKYDKSGKTVLTIVKSSNK